MSKSLDELQRIADSWTDPVAEGHSIAVSFNAEEWNKLKQIVADDLALMANQPDAVVSIKPAKATATVTPVVAPVVDTPVVAPVDTTVVTPTPAGV